MAKTLISEVSRALIEVAWQLGPKGIDGKCCDDLTLAEFMALDRVLANPDCTINSIGASLGFTKSGATRVVDRLEKKRCVKRIKSQKDARVCLVEVTEKGERIIKHADSLYKALAKELSKSEEFKRMIGVFLGCC